MPDRLLVTDATVCDVANETLVPDRRVLVTDGRIEAIGGSEIEPAGVEVLDAGGRTLVPGLVDAHVHVTAATADLGAMIEWSPNYVAAKTMRILDGMLSRGFTTVRDVGGADYGLAAAVDEGLVRGPRVVFGGKALSQTGGHADLRGPGRSALDDHQCCPGLGVVCDGVDEVRRNARNQLRTGAHHIKIMLSGGVASPTDRVDSTQFSDTEILAAVEEAAAANRYVTGHAYTARAVNRGLRLGVRCIEHGNLIDDESVALFAEHDAYLVPTLVTYEFLAREGAAAGLPPASQAKVADVRDAGLTALERAWRGGVSVVFGTDLLGDMHVHQSEEFRIRGRVQPAAEVLKSATVNAARLLGLEGEIGTVTPGAHADLLVVDGDPLTDAEVLAEPEQNVRAIIKGGTVVSDRLVG
ncbi:metal-dependent hydrolase family protein [Solicola gregarius]|uniref:Amidohydrolase family protein n=1 Tax=Solicola gregarius TaxID=2908642 RepID=A0AA46TM65_9ACTN|nr:amidohydrolase family protein [Solicola gregarius]UYM07683.1 amidohydrolase family protein [Solicola gregarius]